ncbi:hypothetical protein JTE90_027843 [Oedothorax gibbosus]|uniref:Uncharacterized protein n=1 Tax=Oedothorax gibbosus TaxID=931172 RepID=A0AAV6U3Z2_9ARAC|nr:hypothetical protein JTE90_027843 [Oedothorax gibbosus]
MGRSCSCRSPSPGVFVLRATTVANSSRLKKTKAMQVESQMFKDTTHDTLDIPAWYCFLMTVSSLITPSVTSCSVLDSISRSCSCRSSLPGAFVLRATTVANSSRLKKTNAMQVESHMFKATTYDTLGIQA